MSAAVLAEERKNAWKALRALLERKIPSESTKIRWGETKRFFA